MSEQHCAGSARTGMCASVLGSTNRASVYPPHAPRRPRKTLRAQPPLAADSRQLQQTDNDLARGFSPQKGEEGFQRRIKWGLSIVPQRITLALHSSVNGSRLPRRYPTRLFGKCYLLSFVRSLQQQQQQQCGHRIRIRPPQLLLFPFQSGRWPKLSRPLACHAMPLSRQLVS